MQADHTCYNCGEEVHYANWCPNSCPRINPLVAATPVPTRGANSVSVATKQNYGRGRVNHVIVEEAQEAPDVVIGMFLINDTSVVVLFDSGYVGKHNLPLALLKYQMIFSSPGGDMATR
jgi:hypothetical protein